MFRIVLLLYLIPLFLCAGEYEDHLKRGGGDPQYLLTWEDKKRLGQFAALYEMAKKREKPSGAIPKTLHFVWLGPKSFPEGSLTNVKNWIDLHPGWKVKFWTDLGHPAPDDRMEVNTLERFPLEDLKDCYFRSDNFGERSEVLSYAILLKEGGVYIDHDVSCLKPLDSLQGNYDFFCGMQPLGPSILSSSINPSPHLLASTAKHPVLQAAKSWLLKEWDRIELQFPGSDPGAIHNRVQHRTFRALYVGYKEAHCRAGRKDVIFPPNYFSLSNVENALYATHQSKGSWYKKETEAELKVHALLAEVARGSESTFWLAISVTIVNLLLGFFLFFKISGKKRSIA